MIVHDWISAQPSLLAAVNRWLVAAAHPLANHLWQSTMYAAVAAALALALKKNQARTRYWIWMSASFKLLLPFALLAGAASHWVKPRPTAPAHLAVYSTVEAFDEPFTLPPVQIPVQHEPISRVQIHAGEGLACGTVLVWLAGFVSVLSLWAVRWQRVANAMRDARPLLEGREVELLRRMERAAHVRRPIQLLASSSAMEPGVFGIVRPVLAWPTAISARLDDAQLEAVLAHEVCHVSRRDNLTAALHMLVEAIFWFHPMVWLIGARLVEERERACDEQVLEVCGRPTAYAESILKVCEYCVQTPLECVSGVTGADLKQRVIEIMSARAACKLTLVKKLLIGVAATCVVAVPFVLSQAQATRRLAAMMMTPPSLPRFMAKAEEQVEASPAVVPTLVQNAPTADDSEVANGHTFEVATIRPANRDDGRHFFGMRLVAAGRLGASAMTLKSLVSAAYVGTQKMQRVDGGPKWAETEQFDINAKVDTADMDGWDKLTPVQQMDRVRPLLRALLEQRFKVKTHTEMMLTPVYALVQAKGGTKMKEVPAPPPVEGDQWEAVVKQMADSPGKSIPGQILCTGESCTGTTVRISDAIGQIRGTSGADRMVIDATGLTGYYDFKMRMTSKADVDAMAQVEEDLGLKFEPRKMMMKTYVIDAAEEPSMDGAEAVGPIVPNLLSVALVRQTTDMQSSGVMEKSDLPKVNPAAFDAVPGKISFDVISFKPCPSDQYADKTMDMPPNSDFIAYHCQPTTRLISFAYGGAIDTFNLASGYPAWVDQDRYEFIAKVSPEDISTWQKMNLTDHRLVMRTVLAETLKLRIHPETSQQSVYALTLAKPNPKLTPTKPGEPEKLPNGQVVDARAAVWIGMTVYFHAYNMGGLASNLTQHLDRPVINQTNLDGYYDFSVPITPGTGWNPYQGLGVDGVPLVDALKSIGLRIDAAKAPFDRLVVDHIERPPAN